MIIEIPTSVISTRKLEKNKEPVSVTILNEVTS